MSHPTPIPSGYGIATIKYSRVSSGAVEVTTFGYLSDSGETPAAEANEIGVAWITVWTAATSLQDYSFIGVHVLRNLGGSYQSADYVTSTPGGVNAAPVPPAVCCVLTKQTSLAGRKFRGRFYLPGFCLPAANVSDSGIIDAGTLGGIQTRANNWLAAMSADATPVLLHKDLSTPDPIINLVARTSVRTQRRRQTLS